MSLNRQQVNIVKEKITHGGVKTPELLEDLLDHLCISVENELARGLSFDAAIERTFNSLDNDELKLTEVNTQALLAGKKMYYPNALQSVGLIVLLYIFSILISICIMALFRQEYYESIFPIIVVASNSLAFGAVLAFAIYRIRESQKNRIIFSFKSIPLFVYPAIAVLALTGSFSLEPLWHIGIIPQDISLKTARRLAQFGFATTLFVGLINTTLVELLLRGIILNGLLKTLTPVKAIIWSAVFGVGINFFVLPLATFSINAFQGWLYWKTKSLLSVITSGGLGMAAGTIAIFYLGNPEEFKFSWQELINNDPLYYGIVIASLPVTYLIFRILNMHLSRS